MIELANGSWLGQAMSFAVWNDELYIGYGNNNQTGVKKVSAGNLVQVGKEGISKVGGEISLVVRNKQLYSITYHRLAEHQEMYIAMPE